MNRAEQSPAEAPLVPRWDVIVPVLFMVAGLVVAIAADGDEVFNGLDLLALIFVVVGVVLMPRRRA